MLILGSICGVVCQNPPPPKIDKFIVVKVFINTECSLLSSRHLFYVFPCCTSFHFYFQDESFTWCTRSMYVGCILLLNHQQDETLFVTQANNNLKQRSWCYSGHGFQLRSICKLFHREFEIAFDDIRTATEYQLQCRNWVVSWKNTEEILQPLGSKQNTILPNPRLGGRFAFGKFQQFIVWMPRRRQRERNRKFQSTSEKFPRETLLQDKVTKQKFRQSLEQEH